MLYTKQDKLRQTANSREESFVEISYLFNKVFHRLLATSRSPHVVYTLSTLCHTQQHSSSVQRSSRKQSWCFKKLLQNFIERHVQLSPLPLLFGQSNQIPGKRSRLATPWGHLDQEASRLAPHIFFLPPLHFWLYHAKDW